MSEEKDYLLKDLNESQKMAVSAPRSNLLIIAGAGTGKTRVLVSRISWLLQVEKLPARSILAVTFTNKAAREMQERICAITGTEVIRQLWTSTFHSICLRLLRSYAKQAGLPPRFTVLDTDSQTALIKRIMVDLKMDVKNIKPSEIASRISKLKERGIRAAEFVKDAVLSASETERAVVSVYPVYEQLCNTEGVADFSELLLRTVELLQKNEAIADLQHRRFREILVDEFQDTNSIQFKFVQLMAGPQCHIMAVGDDDQSIYGWRGADYTNMQRFMDSFENVKLLKLEENYRSGQNILDLANIIISNNSSRLVEKRLRGCNGLGYKVNIIKCREQKQEAQMVVQAIRKLHDKDGIGYSSMAILYRFNNQSLIMEQTLAHEHISCTIFGGQKFFERAEIQDAIAYLRVLINENDDSALLRIINVPSRKLGPKVISQLREVARDRGISLWNTIRLLVPFAEDKTAPKPLVTLARKVSEFYRLIESLNEARQTLTLAEFIKNVIEESGLMEYYRQKDLKDNKSQFDNLRHKNLEDLVSNASGYQQESESGSEGEMQEEGSDDPLLNFISSISLASGAELNQNGEQSSLPDSVNLMTLHSSKGLEYDVVFLVGFEETMLPAARSLNDFNLYGKTKGLEEERRLAYVGVTRARKQLIISYCANRFLYGDYQPTGISMFLKEVGQSLKSVKPEDKPYQFLDVSMQSTLL